MNTNRIYAALAIATTILIWSGAASAQNIALQGAFALNAEGEHEGIVIDSNGFQDEEDGSKEDLEDTLGVDLQLTFGDSVRFGLRGGALAADGEDSEAAFLALEGGGVMVVEIPAGSVDFHIMGGAGVTWLTAEVDGDDGADDLELEGLGFHVMGGAGLTVPLKGGTAFVANVVYHRLQVSELAGEGGSGEESFDLTVEDLVSERVLLMAGVQFDL